MQREHGTKKRMRRQRISKEQKVDSFPENNIEDDHVNIS